MSQSYSNSGGTGLRFFIVISATNLTLGGGGISSPSYLLNGNTTEHACWFPNGAASGKYVKFDFGSPRLVTEAKWYQDNSTSQGTWKWQGSNDDSTYTDIGSSFTLGGATVQTQTQLNGNATSCRYYQLVGVSGSTSDSPYTFECEFQIDAISNSVFDYGNPYGAGDRTASITVTQSQVSGHGEVFVGRSGSLDPTMNLLVDNLNLVGSGASALSFRTDLGAGASGRWIKFEFPTYVIIDQMRWMQDTTDSHGTWKMQGSNDGSTWTDVGTSATLAGTSFDNHNFSGWVGPGGTINYVPTVFDGPNGNTASYIYYRLLGVSGNVNGTPFIYEVAFRIKAGTAPPTASPSLCVIT